MRRQSWVGVVAVALASAVFAACGGPAPEAFGKEDVVAIRKLVTDFVAAYNAKESAKIAACSPGLPR